jgi:hypothetical protein
VYFADQLKDLRRRVQEKSAQRAVEAAAAIADPRAALRTQIAEWQRTLGPETSQSGYLLEDIRKAVNATPQQLGLALWEMGWTRKRVWLSDGPYRRRWYRPDH